MVKVGVQIPQLSAQYCDIRDTTKVMHRKTKQVKVLKELLHFVELLKVKVVNVKDRRADRVS